MRSIGSPMKLLHHARVHGGQISSRSATDALREESMWDSPNYTDSFLGIEARDHGPHRARREARDAWVWASTPGEQAVFTYEIARTWRDLEDGIGPALRAGGRRADSWRPHIRSETSRSPRRVSTGPSGSRSAGHLPDLLGRDVRQPALVSAVVLQSAISGLTSASSLIAGSSVDRFMSAAGQFETGGSVLGSGPAHGRVTVNVEPAPSSLSTVIVPPWATTIERAMYSPSPSPP